MEISRRKFLELFGISGLALGLSSLLREQIVKAFEEAIERGPHLLWIQGASDTGCTVSLLNTVHPTIAEVLLKMISCDFHPTLMASADDLAISILDDVSEDFEGEFILAVEGAVPTEDNGIYCTLGEEDDVPIPVLDWIRKLGAKAQAVLAVGTCAAFGGIPAADPNPTGCRGVGYVLEENSINSSLINLPGCPAHPDWIVGTLFHLLNYGLPELDSSSRPKLFYGDSIHDKCPNRSYFDNFDCADKLGDEKCLHSLGCRGPKSYADCPTRLWNSGVNWCIESKHPCIGCVHPGFPDETSPFYVQTSKAEESMTGAQEEEREEVQTGG